MRLNKRIESKYKFRYDWVMEDLRMSLLVMAVISVGLNTMSSPILGIKALIIFVVSYFASRYIEALYFMFAKELEYKDAIVKVNKQYPEVIGLIFAMLVPIGTPIYAIVVSLGMGIIIGSVAFGGFSHNIFNIPIVAAAILYVSWPDSVGPVLSNNYWLDYILNQVSTFMQTPLYGIMAMPEVVTVNAPANAAAIYPTWSVLTNNPQVMLGLIPTIIILPIGIRLILNDVIDYRIPLMISCLTVIGSFLIAFFMHDSGLMSSIWFGFNSLFGTIMLFIAFFVASEPASSPDSTNTQLIYSMIIVVITLFIREVSSNVEGVVYAILFANMLVPLLNAKSGTMSKPKTRNMMALASVLFVGSMLFIGYNSDLQIVAYQEYDHYSIPRDKLSCEQTDAIASASKVESSSEELVVSSACTVQTEPESAVDATASATTE